MTTAGVHLMVPGSLDQPTGGYVYDRRIVDELDQRGIRLTVHELPGDFPLVDETAIRVAARQMAGSLSLDTRRLRLVALVHHPLYLETGLDPEIAAILHRLEHGCLHSMRRIVVTSGATAAGLAEFGVPAGRVTVIPPGTDPAPRAAGSGGEVLHLLCVGSLVPRKGQIDLVAALAGLADRPWRLTLAGADDRDPGYAGRVRAVVADAGLQNRVTLTGGVSRDALDRMFHSSDLFVLPSHHEGYGMALAEALTRGLPVITTAAGAIPDTVPEEARLMVPPGDVPALTAAAPIDHARQRLDTLRVFVERSGRRERLPSRGS